MQEVSRSELGSLPTQVLRRGHVHKADLLVYEVHGERVLVKDYAAKPGPWRTVFGAFLAGREARVLQALDGIEGVPSFRGQPDRYSVAMAFLPGRQAKKSDPALMGNRAFVHALEALVGSMHERGVVHLDLKHRTNVLVSPQGMPVICDFESALRFNARWWGGRLAVRLLGQLDRVAVQNWKRKICPDMLASSPADMQMARLAWSLSGWWLPRRILGAFVDILLRRRRHRGPRKARRPRERRPASAILSRRRP